MDKFLTIKQLAARWHCAVITVRLKANRGEIPYTRIGKTLLFEVVEIEKIEANGKHKVYTGVE